MRPSRRALALAQDHGFPLGRWPAPSSLEFHLRRVLELYRIDLVLDVGAHRGEYAAMIRRRAGFAGDLISFEPSDEAFRILSANAGQDERWRVEQVALGDETGTGELQHYEHSSYNSFRRPSSFGTAVWRLKVGRSEKVPVVRLDEVDLPLDGHSSSLLKIDTQGFDLQVLQGAAGVLDQISVLQFELPMINLYEGVVDFHSMVAAVETMGFAVSGLFPITHDGHLRVVEFDCIAVRVQS